MSLDAFKEVWVVDYEFRAAPGERPEPLCLVAHEIHSGRKLQRWAEELERGPCPYSLASDSVVVAYYASAEMGCHLALGWPLPINVLDLYVEFRVETNGMALPVGSGLLGALEYYGHSGITAREKDAMRDLVLRGGVYSAEERSAVLEYCASDVIATAKLLQSMQSLFDELRRLQQALLRGRYAKAVAHIEDAGVPIDAGTLAQLRQHWSSLQEKLIARVDAEYGVYEGRTFKQVRFGEYLQREGIAWPRLASGRLALDDSTFDDQSKAHPKLRPLKELRRSLGQLRLSDLAVGTDERNRTLMSMFRSKTGRNQPSNARFIFGVSSWLRGLIKPKDGFGLAYIDWSQQEFGIAAALSGDKRMMEAYLSGDPYLAFARQAGAVPPDATKQSHAAEREQFKACVLAVQYGMQEESLARRIGRPPVYARELLRMHRRTYRKFWEWSDGVRDYALAERRLWTVFGWSLRVDDRANVRSLCNFPMQANGSELLRLACCFATEAGIRVVAPVHDAVLIESPLSLLEAHTAEMQALMRRASSIVLGGFELRSEAKLILAPERYSDDRGSLMWDTVQELLDEMMTIPPEVQS